jgi:RNA polymerase sigma-70 factor (ECF subfamily)
MDGHYREDFASFYAQHAAFMRRALARHGVRAADLDDVAQEAFVIVHRLLPEFEGRSSVETWLHAIAWRVASSYRRRPYLQREGGPTPPCEAAAVESQEPSAWGEALRALWGRIDPEHRDLLALHHVGGFSIAQLAEITGHARATISKRIAQGRAKLGQRLQHGTALERPRPPDLAPDLQHAPQPLRVLSCKQICLSQLDDLVIGIWRGHCTIESMHAVGHAFERALATHPEGIRYLAIVESTSTPPKLEARQLHAELARVYGPKLRAVASATESSTMMVLVSGVLNAYFAIARTPVHMRFFCDLASAVAWLTPYGATDPVRITAHVELMRAQLQPSRA